MAEKFTFYVTSDHIRKNTIINDNVDSELITSMIRKSQDLRIDIILGTALTNRVKDAITAGTVTGDTHTLLNDYIAPTLTEWCLFETIPYISMQAMNIGIVRKSSDNSESASLEDVVWLRKNIRSTCEYYSQRLSDYLCANPELYPEYADWSEDDDSIKPNGT